MSSSMQLSGVPFLGRTAFALLLPLVVLPSFSSGWLPVLPKNSTTPKGAEGEKEHHAKEEEEAKQHHPTDCEEKASPKRGDGRQHHHEGGRGTTIATEEPNFMQPE